MQNQLLSKTQVAWLFSPNLTQTSALHRLKRWMEGDPELMRDLRNAGYRSEQRIFTAKQLAILYDYLGDPTAA